MCINRRDFYRENNFKPSADPTLLHVPQMAAMIEADDLEDLLHRSAGLSRALWDLLCSPGLNCEDTRSRDGMESLAFVCAQYTSAARFAYFMKMDEEHTP